MLNEFLLLIAIIIVIVWMMCMSKETYTSGRNDYRYGFVDTNPTRRVSDAFDSPMVSDVYSGLPLP